MPYINIKVTRENGEPTEAQKAALIAGATELVARVLGRNPATTVVVIDEIDPTNYGLGGKNIKSRRENGL